MSDYPQKQERSCAYNTISQAWKVFLEKWDNMKKKSSSILIVSCGVLIFAFAVGVFLLYVMFIRCHFVQGAPCATCHQGSWQAAGTFGDSFGAFNAFCSCLAFIVILATLVFQWIDSKKQAKLNSLQSLSTSLPAHVEMTNRMFVKCHARVIDRAEALKDVALELLCRGIADKSGRLFYRIVVLSRYPEYKGKLGDLYHEYDMFMRILLDLLPWAMQIKTWHFAIRQFDTSEEMRVDLHHRYWQSFHFDEGMIATMCLISNGDIPWRDRRLKYCEADQYMPSLFHLKAFVQNFMRGKRMEYDCDEVAFLVYYLVYLHGENVINQQNFEQEINNAVQIYREGKAEECIAMLEKIIDE